MNFRQVILILLVLTSFIHLLSATDIVIAIDEGNPPLMYKDIETKEAKGLYPVLAKKIFEKNSHNIILKPLPWKRAMIEGEKGNVGIIGLIKNKSRSMLFDFSKPIFKETISVYTLRSHKFSYTSISDLTNKSVGIIRGWNYGTDFDTAKKNNRFTIIENKTDELNVKMLKNGRIDCLLAVTQSGNAAINKLGYKDDITILDNPISENYTYIAFAKKANKKELINQININIDSMMTDGSYDKIPNDVFQLKE